MRGVPYNGSRSIIRVHRPVIAFLALFAAMPASAQVSGSLTIASEQRFRGFPVTNERPAATLNLFYDHPSGAYAVVSASGAVTKGSGLEYMTVQGSLGFARRLTSGTTVDIGLTRADYGKYSSLRRSANYTEAYVGIIGKHLSTHVYLSPHYFVEDVSTLYAEIDGRLLPARGWRLTGHVGMLRQIGGPQGPSGSLKNYDWRVGVARQIGALDLHLNWVGRFPKPAGNRPERFHRKRLVFGLTYTF